MTSGTYFIEAIGLNRIKIGSVLIDGPQWKKRAVDRCKLLNCASPVHLRVILATARVNERTLHWKFSHLRIKGEWFKGSPELWCFIDYLMYRPIRRKAQKIEEQEQKAV